MDLKESILIVKECGGDEGRECERDVRDERIEIDEDVNEDFSRSRPSFYKFLHPRRRPSQRSVLSLKVEGRPKESVESRPAGHAAVKRCAAIGS